MTRKGTKKICKYRHRDTNVQRKITHSDSRNAAEKDSTSIIDDSKDHLNDICPVVEERNDSNKSDKVVRCGELVMCISRKASRKLANDVFKFLHSTHFSACDYRGLLPKMEKFEDSAHKRTTDRFFGLILAPVASGNNISQEEEYNLFMKIATCVICHQLKLAKSEQVLFRPSVLNTGLQIGVRRIHHTCHPDTPYVRQINKLVR